MITIVALALLVASLASVPARGRPAQACDLSAASREVSPWWNASAISGEYISAAAFLGMAGLVLAYGADMLWLPIGAAAGHVVLLALVTAPVRRSGAYTLSDFAEWRLGSRKVRRAVSACVLVVGWFYLLPQFQGAGVTLSVISGLPVWMGWLVVVLAVAALVLPGGVCSITGVQAVQFWLKLMAVAIPALVFVAVWRLHDADATRPPYFHRATTVRAGVSAAMHLSAPTMVAVRGVLDGRRHHGERVPLTTGRHRVRAGARLAFPAGAEVPHTPRFALLRGDRWATPFAGGREHPLAATYSVLLATVLGTMGLPQIMVRFYTNACGRTARRTASIVVLMLAMFYLFPALFGTLGRLYAPELLMTGETDATLLVLPRRIVPGITGDLLTALVATGAFAAFTSTSCGVVVAVSGGISRRLLGGGVRGFRAAVVIAVLVPLFAAPWACTPQSTALVTVAFAVAASSLCPLLVLGVWWRRLTPPGAAAGLVAGGLPAAAAGLVRVLGGSRPATGWLGMLIEQPAIVTVPLAFAAMVTVSLLTPGRVPGGTDEAMIRMHLPEEAVPEDRP